MSKFIKTSLGLFGLLCIVFIPFPFHIFPFQQGITDFIFKNSIGFVAENIFHIHLSHPEISSDATYFYLLVLLLFIISALLAMLFSFYKKWYLKWPLLLELLRMIFNYYLALQLLKYGFDKVFKQQFYLPEPNLLYTPLGQLDKDILYWSTIGLSYSYNIFLGASEVMSAIFICFKKTRIAGQLLALVLMLNVFAVNISFDISVKLYSLFLLFLTMYLLAPQISSLYRFFILKERTRLEPETTLIAFFQHPFSRIFIKTFVIGVIFTEALYPALSSRNFNDDMAQRPYLHGAYEVIESSPANTADLINLPVKRIFIHRNGYIIFQNIKDEMADYKLDIDIKNHKFQLTDYQLQRFDVDFSYLTQDSILELTYFKQNQSHLLKCKAINWRNLPVLQHQFHWTIEGVNNQDK